MFRNSNSLDYVFLSLKEGQKIELKNLLLKFKEEGFKDLGYPVDFDIDEICNKIDFDIQFEKERKLAVEAAEKGETTIPKNNWPVHIGHCCKKHGCKYGDVDCPVALGLAEQKHPCEFCN